MKIKISITLTAGLASLTTATIDIEEQTKLKMREMAIFRASEEAESLRALSPEEELIMHMPEEMLMGEGYLPPTDLSQESFDEIGGDQLETESDSGADSDLGSDSDSSAIPDLELDFDLLDSQSDLEREGI